MQAHEILQKLGRLAAVALALMYVAAGLFLILASAEMLPLSVPVRLGFGLLLILYGCVRFIRALRNTTFA